MSREPNINRHHDIRADGIVARMATAGQALAVQWGHEPWSDSWAERVAQTLLEASGPAPADPALQAASDAYIALREAAKQVLQADRRHGSLIVHPAYAIALKELREAGRL
jgi:hypothetical protein